MESRRLNAANASVLHVPVALGIERQAGHNGRGLDLAIAQGKEDFEHFAPGWKGPAIGAFVLVHRLHEGDLIVVVIAFASSRIDLTTAFALMAAFRAGTAFEGDRNG